MSCPVYWCNQCKSIIDHIVLTQPKLILIAWGSWSGKSWVCEQLKERLIATGKKVLTISSDNYYSNESAIKYLLYGSFDHPDLIDYSLLSDNLTEYFASGKTSIPNYSFVEKRRIGKTLIDGQYDIVIVEWLYTINKLSEFHNSLKIFVHADLEEVIFRRIIRDQKRVSEPIHTIISVMSTVFPMRNIFGKQQKDKADLVIHNNYSILSNAGKVLHRRKLNPKTNFSKNYWVLNKKEYITDYIYDDNDNKDEKIVVSEVYDEKRNLLQYVTITKRWSIQETLHGEEYSSIAIDLYQPGIITELHTLLQLAGLKFVESHQKEISYYTESDGSSQVVKEKLGSFYELQS